MRLNESVGDNPLVLRKKVSSRDDKLKLTSEDLVGKKHPGAGIQEAMKQ